MPRLKLISGPYRSPPPDPEWYDGGPDLYQVMRVYQHEVHGRIIVPTIVREGAALIDLAHIFRWEVANNRSLRVRKAWAARCKRRQEKSGEAPAEPRGGGEPKGPGKRPPAAHRGGGEAA